MTNSGTGPMAGKTVLVTGGTSGIGKATAAGLAALGARVAITGRDPVRTRDAAADIAAAVGNPAVDPFAADMSSQAAVRRLAKEILNAYPRLDVLVNNAGGFWTTRRVTADGLEQTFAVNHLGVFLLTNLLLDRLKRHPPRLGHESMMAIPAFRAAATALSESLRVTPGTPVRLVSEGDFALPAVDSMLRNRLAIVRQLHGWSHENALLETQHLCTHLAAAVNHIVAGKKTFWVSAELVEALRQTNLDVSGDVLELPFPACAFVFNDALTFARKSADSEGDEGAARALQFFDRAAAAAGPHSPL